MRDEQKREALLLLQVLHQVDDLRLDRDIERRDRLVCDDEAGIDRDRPRDADPLALAARELARIAVHRPRAAGRRASVARRPARAAPGGGFTRPKTSIGSAMMSAMVRRGLSEPYGSWKTICILRRICRISAPRQRRHVRALEQDAARGRLDQPQQQPAERGLATPGFRRRQPASRRAVDLEAHPVDGAHVRPRGPPSPPRIAGAKILPTVLGLDDRLRSCGPHLRRLSGDPAGAPMAGLECRDMAGISSRADVHGADRSGRRRGSPCGWCRPAAPSRGSGRAACVSSVSDGHRSQQPLRVGVLRVRGRASATSASSTIRPAYMTTTRSQTSAMTPRSCEISRIAVFSLLPHVEHQVQHLRLDGHVERRRRLVGDQQLRIAGHRHGDHHPLPHPARELVRIGARAGSPDRGCRQAAAARSPVRGARRGSCSRAA